jgi:hypothetical protein
MAKRQSLSLNPSKISGQCGRLLCCLAYEDDQYKRNPDKPSPGPVAHVVDSSDSAGNAEDLEAAY